MMATADLVILGIVLLSALVGLMRGLLKEILALATWAAAIGLALYFAPSAAVALTEHIADETIRLVVGFGAIFLATLLLGALAQKVLALLVQGTGLSGTDRILGTVFGAVRGVLVCLVVLIAIKSFAQGTAWWQASRLVPELLAFEQDLLGLLGKSTEWLSRAGGGE